MPIKTLGSLGKIRVGQVTGNTHIFFFGLIMQLNGVGMNKYKLEGGNINGNLFQSDDAQCEGRTEQDTEVVSQQASN